MEPRWIGLRSVLAIHDRQLAEHGGQPGVRDLNGLESALARPQNLLAYSEEPPSLFQLAAAYAVGVTKNPFIDGNKRTAAVICLLFLAKNGMEIEPEETELAVTFEMLAAGTLSESRLTRWVEESAASGQKKPSSSE